LEQVKEGEQNRRLQCDTAKSTVLSASQFAVVSSTGGDKTVYTGKGQDAFPFPATWLWKTELLYTGDGHLLHVCEKSPSISPLDGTDFRTSRAAGNSVIARKCYTVFTH
jgi:hypothetical protein